MRNLKSALVLLGLFFCVTVVSAQKKSNQEKAAEKIETINNQIISIDESLALNDDQTKALIDLQLVKLDDVKKIKKSDLSEEEIKVKLKAVYKRSYDDMSKVISKEQMKAYKKGKKKQK